MLTEFRQKNLQIRPEPRYPIYWIRRTGHISTCSSAAREDSDPGIVIILNLNGFLFFFQRIG